MIFTKKNESGDKWRFYKPDFLLALPEYESIQIIPNNTPVITTTGRGFPMKISGYNKDTGKYDVLVFDNKTGEQVGTGQTVFGSTFNGYDITELAINSDDVNVKEIDNNIIFTPKTSGGNKRRSTRKFTKKITKTKKSYRRK